MRNSLLLLLRRFGKRRWQFAKKYLKYHTSFRADFVIFLSIWYYISVSKGGGNRAEIQPARGGFGAELGQVGDDTQTVKFAHHICVAQLYSDATAHSLSTRAPTRSPSFCRTKRIHVLVAKAAEMGSLDLDKIMKPLVLLHIHDEYVLLLLKCWGNNLVN
jgi:hypothetical protein